MRPATDRGLRESSTRIVITRIRDRQHPPAASLRPDRAIGATPRIRETEAPGEYLQHPAVRATHRTSEPTSGCGAFQGVAPPRKSTEESGRCD